MSRPELADRHAQIALTRARVLAPLVVFSISAALVLSPASNIPLTHGILVVNAIVLASIAALTVGLWLRKVPLRAAHLAAAVVWWAPITTSLASFSATHNSRLFILLILEMFAGVIIPLPIWVIGSFIVFDLIWVPLTILVGGEDAFFAIITVITAQLFATVIHRLKHHSLEQSEIHRLALERQLGETQRSEQARAELAEQLVHAQRLEAIGTLAAGLAHDMNNVLAAIMGFADGVVESSDDPQTRDDCREIMREAERGAELTRGLLTFSRRGQYRKQVLRVGELVDDVVALLGRTLPKTVQIEKQVVALDACIEGDPTQFSQMLVNLGINASDAMAGKGHLVLRSEVVDGQAKISVTDTGTGMDEATRSRIFEPFFTTKEMGKGTGLGLALVWGVVTKARGTITVDSELGRGTTFTITLPLTDKQPARAMESGSIRSLVPQRGTVLVVDDEPSVRSSTSRMLERLGLRAIAADGGQSALKLFDAHQTEIALVVLDMGMPGMNGAEVFRALRERSNVKVLIATGYAMEEEVQALVATGARVLEKPYKIQALEEEVKRALKRN